MIGKKVISILLKMIRKYNGELFKKNDIAKTRTATKTTLRTFLISYGIKYIL